MTHKHKSKCFAWKVIIALLTLWPSLSYAISPGAIQGLNLLFIDFVVAPLSSLAGAIAAAVLNHRRGYQHPYAASLIGAFVAFFAVATWAAVSYGRDIGHMGTIFIGSIIYTTVPVLVIGLVVGTVAAYKRKSTRSSGKKDE